MTAADPRLTRRGLLLATVVAAAGCTAGCTRARPAGVEPGPDDDALRAALASERALLAAYAATAPQHQAHLAHLRALAARLSVPPAASAAPTPQPLADERATVPVLQAAAAAARTGANAALLASIAASHEVIGTGR